MYLLENFCCFKITKILNLRSLKYFLNNNNNENIKML